MQIHAASIGEAVPRETFDAEIRSVFDSAVNLRLANEDRLLTVFLSDGNDLPQGIRITEEIPLRSLRVGLAAVSKGGILRFDLSPLTIDLRSASVWRCRISELSADISSASTLRSWSAAWVLLNEEQRRRNTDIIAEELFQSNSRTPFSRKIGPSVLRLINAVEKFDDEGAFRAAEEMIGLGPGVTPSGDDILIGFLGGVWSTAGKDRKKLTFIRSFGNAIMQLADRTSEISRTYLYHAGRGRFSSSLSNLAQAMAAGEDIKSTAKFALQVGHSSGADSVTGLLIGFGVHSAEIRECLLESRNTPASA